MIKTIIFDLGGVYFTNGTKIFTDVLNKKYGISEEKLKEVLQGKLGSEYRTGKISMGELACWAILQKNLRL